MEAHSVRALAVEAWRRAEAMGLVEPDARRLDAADVARLLRRRRDAGIAREPALRFDNGEVPCVEEAEALLRVVIAALDASPIAKLEWPAVLRSSRSPPHDCFPAGRSAISLSVERRLAARRRWHAGGEGPDHYFADTPDGAWAELLRHEEITDREDVVTLRRALWAVEIGDEPLKAVSLPKAVLIGGVETYEACQNHARRLRARGARRLVAPSAALVTGGAAARAVVAGGDRAVAPHDGRVIVVCGAAGALVGWKAVERGAPPVDVLPRVRQVQPTV